MKEYDELVNDILDLQQRDYNRMKDVETLKQLSLKDEKYSRQLRNTIFIGFIVIVLLIIGLVISPILQYNSVKSAIQQELNKYDEISIIEE
jgi:uncharacterized membrane protein YraQ (UPF0718 family)